MTHQTATYADYMNYTSILNSHRTDNIHGISFYIFMESILLVELNRKKLVEVVGVEVYVLTFMERGCQVCS